ncbi:metalloregulator ArsR/SmtB family transcription factor [Cohnella sp. CFH 77786]|uniref:ArsR/SmtB family transcription factor n=1 Tax=Cohnella sp. CFH 77786 TaxID=2662265 RepID=UPI001C60D401|nr:metalloregulator ArsR/SmtB family transcription factor [Cohnella sp. CFH 77786]MBW5447144.1 metalloregulator ArsR/SmtB family transcription factor [Cohnella sp. CFH 77786]
MTIDVFSALSDPTRRSIVEMLSSTEHLTASEIYENFQVSPQAISKHLKILRESNIVHVEKKAQQRLYSINADTLRQVEDWVRNVSHRWSRRLDALDSVLKSERKRKEHAESGGNFE